MLIDVAESRPYGRDLEVQALIEYFDQPDKSSWDLLTASDIKLIVAQLECCRKDFRYAARNYFWITTKDRGEVLLTLNDSQELIFEEMQRLKALGRAQLIMIVKSRQLGCSTFIEGLIGWRSILFNNVKAMVISYDQTHAAELFGIMQHVYDKLPWWMQPMCASRKFEEGLWFENPEEKARRLNPGLNSKVSALGVNKVSGGIGQGFALSAAHCSEFPTWREETAKRVIDEDLGHALAENPEVFGFLEGTGKGAGKFAHKLWKRNEELGMRSRWRTLFLPSFLDKSHFIAPPDGWTVKSEEAQLADRVTREWLRCDEPGCLQLHRRRLQGRDRTGQLCTTCNVGTMAEYHLPDGFMRWMEVQRINAIDDDGQRRLRQEQAITPEDAFQASSAGAFTRDILEWVNSRVRDPIATGTLDKHLRFHTADHETGRCRIPECEARHAHDEFNFWIWELPEEGAEYCVSVDVASGGGGECDYSVIWVNRVSRNQQPDRQVARFRANDVLPSDVGIIAVRVALWYNRALLAIEYNTYTACGDMAHNTLQYPNLYRWRLRDTMTNQYTTQVHWRTNLKTRPAMFDTGRRWLRAKQWEIMSRNCLEEMKTCKVDEDNRTEHQKDFKDDELIAGLISLHASHEADFDPSLGYVPISNGITLETAAWHMNCASCLHVWPAQDPISQERCPLCQSRFISGDVNPKFRPVENQQPAEAWPAQFREQSEDPASRSFEEL